ncbi:MAG TPA: hypothetical protein VFH33_02820 [Candidatus Krumholzibacteria bacterium]|nr:hypothetical protein [Candidatus Krumholzibacteria bacterium]
MKLRILLGLLAVITAVGAFAQNITPTPAPAPKDTELDARQAKIAAYTGTWTGTSTCVGKNRPACKNEVVVYRFMPFPAAPWQTRLLADKIIEGKRLPMGALIFQYDDKTGGIRSEFKIGNTHGVWSFTAEGDSLVGELIILPAGGKGRDVRAHRTDDGKVPTAPALKEYEE